MLVFALDASNEFLSVRQCWRYLLDLLPYFLAEMLEYQQLQGVVNKAILQIEIIISYYYGTVT